MGEFVVIGDVSARAILHALVRGKGPEDRVFNLGYSALGAGLKRTAAALGVHAASLAPYALRRGGASYHFRKYGSLDHTTSYGRWALAATARRYISQAMCDVELVKIPEEGRERSWRLTAVLPVLQQQL